MAIVLVKNVTGFCRSSLLNLIKQINEGGASNYILFGSVVYKENNFL